MAKPPVDVSVDQRDFAEFLGKTSTLEKKVKTSLRKQVRVAGQEAAKAVQAEVQKPPILRGDSPMPGRPRTRGLRRKIAAGITVSIATAQADTAGVSVKASAKMLPAGQKRLLKLYNKEKGWRHPSLGTARRMALAKTSGQTLRAMGLAGAAKDAQDIARNVGKWHAQKGRPYFGKVLSARQPELEAAVVKAVEDARKSAGLP